MTDSALSELGQAAVWYCEHGFGIIPIAPRGKHPFAKVAPHGLNDWFDNPEDARRLWGMFPDLNIGIVCGSPSHGLLVLDLDVDEEREKDGYATLSAWERARGELPETAVAITGSGGMHYLYRTERTNIHPSANPELGVDVRCDGSYIVAPPSVHPNGRRYEWQDHPDDVPIATATGAVYDFLDHVQRNGGRDETRKDNGKFRLPDKIAKGGRDKTLFRYASHLRAIGRSDAEILNAVMGANFMRCDPPLDSKDVQRVVRSACRYERGESADELPTIGAPGTDAGAMDGDVPNFRGKGGAIRPNLLGRVMMDLNHARLIDGAPAVWTGRRWEWGKRAIGRLAISYADDIAKAKIDETYNYLLYRAPDVTSDLAFADGYYVQFSNCTWDVMACEVVEPDWTMLVTATLPIELDLDAPYGVADRFIESLAANDEPTIRVMHEVVGACMCCRRVMSQSPMLIGRADASGGEASNGKSTYIKTIQSLLGPENYSSLDIATLGQRFQAARVLGKLANLGDDIPNGFLRGEELSLFKKLITGEQIYTDVKGGEGFEFRPNATMVFSMNSMPRLADTTDGVFRRLAFVPFRRRFAPGLPGYDPDIARTMARPENLQRLALLGLMALPDLIRRGALTDIPDMRAEAESIRIENDGVLRWLFDRGITEGELVGRWLDDLYREYAEWCRESGESAVKKSTLESRIVAANGRVFARDTRDRANNRRGKRFEWRQGDNMDVIE